MNLVKNASITEKLIPTTAPISDSRAKVVFADVHGPVLGKDQPSANLSLLYLAGYLKTHAPLVETRYLSQRPEFGLHLETIEAMGADIYAISFTSFSAAVAIDMIKQIKQRFPELVVVIGGPHVSTHAEQTLRASGADLCVIGEGEVTFYEIVDQYKRLLPLRASIQGIAYLENDQLVKTPNRPLIEDLDSIPFPDRDLLDQSDFTGTSYSKASPNTEVIITRGCPLRCVFCANPVFRLDNGPLFRARSPQSIAAEVEDLYQRGYREIYFHSDELNVRLGWSIALCKALAELGHDDLYFQCNMRVVPMNEDLAYWMKRANFWLVRVGIESANTRVLKGIKKRMSLAKIERACQLWSDQGIKVFGFLMMFNAWEEDDQLQIERPDEVEETIRFIYKLWMRRHLHYVSWQFAVPVPGAELYDVLVRHGAINDDFLPDHEWRPDHYLDQVDTRTFNKIYKRALRQQAVMAATSGNIEWRNWRMLLKDARMMLFGKSEISSDEESAIRRG